MFEKPEILYFFLTAPVLFYIVFSDLKFMRIFNGSNILLFCLFFVTAPFLYELSDFSWRLLAAVIALGIGFFLNLVGLMGGGDAKFLPAAAPYIAFSDYTTVLLLLAFFSILTVVVHRTIVLIPSFNRVVGDWESWNNPKMNGRAAVPYGVALALTLSVYLFLKAFIV